jgi:hypothetical protein
MEDAIRVIVFKEDEFWVAQCLEYDIAAQAEDLDTLRSRLFVTLKADLAASIEIRGEPFAGIDPAPPFFHNLWNRKASEFRVTRSLVNENNRPVTVELALAA